MRGHFKRDGDAARREDRRRSGRPAAFFDLDGTLLTVNSGRLWLRRERRNGRINVGQALKGIMFLGLYRLGSINIERAMSEALETVRGEPEERLRRWTREWYWEEVASFGAPGAAAVLTAHRAAGHPLVLLTSSSPYASECAVEQFELDDYLSTVYELDNKRFTGRVVPPICYGAGKVEKAEAYARDHDIDLDGSWFYSDSATDLPMLERVARPRVVHPDPRLRREARRRGGPILDWAAAGGEPMDL